MGTPQIVLPYQNQAIGPTIGQRAQQNSIDHGTPVTFPEDESFDIGRDTRTGVALLEYRYDPPFKFTGKINKVTFNLKPEQTAENDPKQPPAQADAIARAKDPGK